MAIQQNPKERNQEATSRAQTSISTLKSLLSGGGASADIEAYALPVEYAIVVRQKATSTLTPAQYQAKLAELNLSEMATDLTS